MCVCVCVCVCAFIIMWVDHVLLVKSCADFFFIDGFKTETGVAVASISTKCSRKPLTCHLPDDSSIIYTADLRAILLALKHVYRSKEKSFFILSDSLSSLKALFNLNMNTLS